MAASVAIAYVQGGLLEPIFGNPRMSGRGPDPWISAR